MYVPPVTKGSKKAERNSVFSWIIVLALLGVWMSVAVVWFDLVEYSSVVGTLGGVYDADGDGDFDAEDAKVILGELQQKLKVSSTDFTKKKSNLTYLVKINLIINWSFGLMYLCTLCTGKKKKPKLFNKFDKIIKSEISAADKLRKKGKVEEALHAFEALVQKYPQSPRCRYGKAQAEDDVAEKLRSNEMLLKAVTTYREVAELPDTPADLIKATLKRCADRQQFLGRMRGSLATLEKLVHIFPDDITLKNDLGVAHLLIGDNKGAKGIYEEVLTVAPNDGFAKVHYGFILKSENKIAESIPYLREGLESGEPGTDDGRFYFHLGDALQRTGDVSQAYKWYEAGYQHGHFASVWQRSLYNVAGLRAQPWWSAKETGYTDLVRMLEQNWKIIRDEALLVLDAGSGQFLPEDENLRETGDWGQFTLWQQGRKVPSSCQSVPKTCAFMERYPETTTCKRGQIKFSVMQPGTHVWPHTGPTNCRLRMHLGLVIPPRGCQIRCTNQTRNWEEGKVLIFDDSFEHEVWQEADSYRLIFIVDVWHPELSQSQRHALSPI
uniref:Uncharacterized protein n=1 Tax=Electrophorus electricus TaxID=8005 RepID=A0A4W4DVM8_ELEEL